MLVVENDVESHRALVQDIYDKIIIESSRVLHSAKLFSIDILRQEDPTYAEMAKALHLVCDMIDLLVEHANLKEHIWTCSKARDYAQFVANVAKAIEEDDDVELQELVKQMDKRSFL